MAKAKMNKVEIVVKFDFGQEVISVFNESSIQALRVAKDRIEECARLGGVWIGRDFYPMHRVQSFTIQEA